MIANTPKPPYYAVIFTSVLSDADDAYAEMANNMVDLAKIQSGFLGFETSREETGISVSYWKDLDSIKKWKNNLDHMYAQKMGKEKWYKEYKTRISRVEYDYGFRRTD